MVINKLLNWLSLSSKQIHVVASTHVLTSVKIRVCIVRLTQLYSIFHHCSLSSANIISASPDQTAELSFESVLHNTVCGISGAIMSLHCSVMIEQPQEAYRPRKLSSNCIWRAQCWCWTTIFHSFFVSTGVMKRS